MSQITAVAIGVSLLSSSAFALYKTAHDVIRPYPQMQIIAWLASKDLHFGIADYWYAYSITFLTDEAVILDPLRDGYIPDYAPIVAREPRIAYLDTTPPAGPSIRLRGIEYRVHETRQFTGPKPFPYDPHSSQTVYASVLERRP